MTFYAEGLNSDLQNEIKESVVKDFLGELKNPRVTLASTVYASRFYQAIQSVTDTPINNIQISLNNGAFANLIEIPANVSPTLTEDDVSIIFES